MGPGHFSNLVKLMVNVVFLSLCVTGGSGKDKELQNFHYFLISYIFLYILGAHFSENMVKI